MIRKSPYKIKKFVDSEINETMINQWFENNPNIEIVEVCMGPEYIILYREVKVFDEGSLYSL